MFARGLLPAALVAALVTSGCLATYTNLDIFVDQPGYFAKVESAWRTGAFNATRTNASWNETRYSGVVEPGHGPTQVDAGNHSLDSIRYTIGTFKVDGQRREEFVGFSGGAIRGETKASRSDADAAKHLRTFLRALVALDPSEEDALVSAYLDSRFVWEPEGVSKMSVDPGRPLQPARLFENVERFLRQEWECCLEESVITDPQYVDEDGKWRLRFTVSSLKADDVDTYGERLVVTRADRVYVGLFVADVGLSKADATEHARLLVERAGWPPVDFAAATIHMREGSS